MHAPALKAASWGLSILGAVGALFSFGCAGDADFVPVPQANCTDGQGYPDGVVDPLADGEVIAPYRWPVAIDAQNQRRALDLNRVFCEDDDIDWSPFDMLLFVSVPAW